VAGTGAVSQTACHFAQDAVADRMSQGVVDVLEPLQVEHEQRGGRRPREYSFYPPVQPGAVGKSGQQVGIGQLQQLVLLAPAGGDVLQMGVEYQLALVAPAEQGKPEPEFAA